MFQFKQLRSFSLPAHGTERKSFTSWRRLLLKFLLFLAVFAGMWHTGKAGDTTDRVWRRITDQADGFWMVKFSNNDSLIVGHGYEMDLFFDTKTGQEIKRIPGNNEVFFIENDKKFIKTNEPRLKFEIFDTETYQVIDSLENDGTQSTGSISINKNETYLTSTIPHGIRVWDLKTEKIKKTKIIPEEPNLVYREFDNVFFSCDENKIIGHLIKTYQDTSHPGDPTYYKTYGYYNVYDFNTLDSVDTYINSRGFISSKTCRYFAQATGDPNFGVEVYDFITKQLLWKLPVNGPSLTGIEFSPDDKYVITSPTIKIWSIETGKEIYSYKSGDCRNISLNHDGKLIASSIGNYLYLWNTRYNGTIVKANDNQEQSTLYPNPSTGLTTIKFSQPYSEITQINLTDLTGVPIKVLYSGLINNGNQLFNFTTNDLSIGSYFVIVQNTHLSLFFKLIVNK